MIVVDGGKAARVGNGEQQKKVRSMMLLHLLNTSLHLS